VPENEVRPQQDPSCLRRAFSHSYLAAANLPFSDWIVIARGDVVNTCTPISNVRQSVVNTRAIASELQSGGDTGKATGHPGIALRITPSFNGRGQLFWTNYALRLELFVGEGRFDITQNVPGRAGSMTRTVWVQARNTRSLCVGRSNTV